MIWYGFNTADTSTPLNIISPPLLCKLTKYSPFHHEAACQCQIPQLWRSPISSNIILKILSKVKYFFITFLKLFYINRKQQIFGEFKLFWGQKAITLEFWFNEHNFSANTNILSHTEFWQNVLNKINVHNIHFLYE